MLEECVFEDWGCYGCGFFVDVIGKIQFVGFVILYLCFFGYYVVNVLVGLVVVFGVDFCCCCCDFVENIGCFV